MLHGIDDADLPAAAFERNLAWLSRRFRIVPLAQLVDGLREGRPAAAGGELALTFDDGLRNHVDTAYPILQRLGAPATFFVCPELIEQQRWIWTQEARSRLQSMAPADRQRFAQEGGAVVASPDALVERMKGMPIAARRAEEARLRQWTPGYVASESARRRFDPMRWDDFPRLDAGLVTIGSHTLTHPILPSVDDAMLEQELADSRRVLEHRLGRTVDLFCYPNGSQDARVRAAVGRVYAAAVTTEYGLVAGHGDVHGLKRIPVTSHLPLMAWRMHRPSA